MSPSRSAAESPATTAGATAREEICASGEIPPFDFEPVTPRLLVGRAPLSELDAAALVEAGATHVLDPREPGLDAPERARVESG